MARGTGPDSYPEQSWYNEYSLVGVRMRVHFVQHESYEAPGSIKKWAEKRGFEISWSRVFNDEPLPRSTEGIDLLIVLGGPQSPDTPKAECPHFDAIGEKALIAESISAKKAVVGVCLGAQLIGEALGAKYQHSKETEIGVFPIVLTADGLQNEKIAHFGSSLEVGHWHSDMPGLTPASRVLARSAGCDRQIVEYSNLVYGLQCHLEITTEVVELLIAASASDFARLRDRKYVQQPDTLRKYNFDDMNAKMNGFLDRLMEEYDKHR